MKALKVVIFFLAVEFLLFAFAIKTFPDAPPLGIRIIGMTTSIVSIGLARKLAQ